jgi:hypothetical protein
MRQKIQQWDAYPIIQSAENEKENKQENERDRLSSIYAVIHYISLFLFG